MKYYACIDKGNFLCAINYEPNVSGDMVAYEITEEDYTNLTEYGFDYYFDQEEKAAKKKDEAVILRKKEILEHVLFLKNSDWKVLRHLREKALGLETSMTEEEYLSLEKERHERAKSI